MPSTPTPLTLILRLFLDVPFRPICFFGVALECFGLHDS